ncbi:Cytochrome P450 monooxygenase [Pseudocercospora fuligena]|uniref:Cytochrome P450 monooxygenase n=1 Tax=Pseudocercospora fuligena TaxID=685502 RepID=A0A8H6VF66_9PEZI|nr:Cytochrome P450 monooxygenase [Pseudocercospora fuligena]
MNGHLVYTILSLIKLIAKALTIVGILWISIDYLRVLWLRRKLPPGPFPLPLIGNHLDMRMKRPWRHWEKLSFEIYRNPMITLWNGHRPVICCNDAWTVSDMFEKRATIYSSRPRMVMMGDMTNTTNHNQVCLKYDDQWRTHRKLSHSVVGTQAVRAYRDFQSSETKILLEDLLTRPDNYVPAIERYSCSIVSIVGWGRRIRDINDPVAQRALEFMEVVNAVIPGQAVMEMIPWLSELPNWINPIPKIIDDASKRLNNFWQEMTEEAAAMSDQANLFSKRLIRERDAGTINCRELGNLTANLIGGGSKRKHKKKLDRIVGQARLPDWSDEDSLPYITATAAETLRWRTVTTLGGLPHAPTQDDEYRGYHIPKDTWIVGNIWAIHRNPKDYPDPDDFHPERLLWAFDIRPGLDEDGKEVKLDIFAYTASENQRPEPFKARFIPRTPEIRDLILKEAESARVQLAKYDGETKVRLPEPRKSWEKAS